jgi:hypothetical protein
METNLRPEFEFEAVRTPVAIQREQANGLGQRTQNILVGDIINTNALDEQTDEPVIIYQFFIKAPTLSNFRFLLLRLAQGTTLFPVKIHLSPADERFEYLDEEGFCEKLRYVFHHEKTAEIIKSLYAQSVQWKGS